MQDKSKPDTSVKNNPLTNSKTKQEIDYFIAGPGTEAIRVNIYWCVHRNWVLERHILPMVRDNTDPYQVSQRCIAYVLQEPFKKDLERVEYYWILAPLGVDKTAEWCNSYVTVANPSCFLMSRPGKTYLGTNRASTQKANINWHTSQTNKYMLFDHNQYKFRISQIENC